MKNIFDYIQDVLEAKTIDITKHANKQVTAKYGNCIVLAGGPASGKSYVTKNAFPMPTSYKTFDVDSFKKTFLHGFKKGKKSFKNIADKYGIDTKGEDDELKNSDFVSKLHGTIKDRGWKEKQQSGLVKGLKGTNKEHLPNLIYDITAKDTDDVTSIIDRLKEFGYYITLVWVVCSRQRAIVRNYFRPRSVGDSTLHSIHNKIMETVPALLEDQDISKNIDQAWLYYSSGEGLKEMTDAEKKDKAVFLKKNEDGSFDLNPEKERLLNILGKSEEGLDGKGSGSLKTYKTTNEIFGKGNEYQWPNKVDDSFSANYTFYKGEK